MHIAARRQRVIRLAPNYPCESMEPRGSEETGPRRSRPLTASEITQPRRAPARVRLRVRLRARDDLRRARAGVRAGACVRVCVVTPPSTLPHAPVSVHSNCTVDEGGITKMPRYPTEVLHGTSGYRGTAGLSEAWANDPGEPLSPWEEYLDYHSQVREISRYGGVPDWAELIGDAADTLGFLAPPALVTDPISPRVINPRPPTPTPGLGPWRNAGVAGVGFLAGWYLGTLIWGDPFAEPGQDGELTFPPGWNHWCVRGDQGHSGGVRWYGSGQQNQGTNWNGPWGPCSDHSHRRNLKDQTFHVDQTNNISVARARYVLDAADPDYEWCCLTDTWLWNLGQPGDEDMPYFPVTLTPGYGTPLTFPSEEPELAPIMWPGVPLPTPWPDLVTDPLTQPSADPLTEYPPGVVAPVVSPFVPPVVLVPDTVVDPSTGNPTEPVIPTVVIQPSPDGNGVIVTPGDGPTVPREPPGPNDREFKGYTNAGPRWLRVVVNVYTEANDFVASLYAGVRDLHEGPKCHPYDMQCMLGHLWEQWDNPEFNAAEFIEAFLNNQFEDYFYGMLGQYVGNASRNLNILTGLNRAINEGGNSVNEFLEEQGIEQDQLLPELVHNAETGEWLLVWDLFGIVVPAP